MQVDIAANLARVNERIISACQRSGRAHAEVTLVAVTKNVGVDLIQQAYECGVRDFGENRIQEARTKVEAEVLKLPGIKWHLVGHLQSNKAGHAATLFHVIHSVDSVKVARILNDHSTGRLTVLVQVNVSGEATKYGVSAAELGGVLEKINDMENLDLQGLMTIAPLTGDTGLIRSCFRELRRLALRYNLKHLSMGMSDDFEIAIEEGATIIRVGRAIFGERR